MRWWIILITGLLIMNNAEIEKQAQVYAFAQENLVNYRSLFCGSKDDVAPADFHYTWSDILLNGEGNYAIEGFRGCAKTSYVMRAYPQYCITYPTSDKYIVIIKNTQTQAESKLLEIIADVKLNELIAQKIIKIHQESSKVFCLNVLGCDGKKHKIRFEAYGKGASIRGLSWNDRRPDVIILDDIQDLEDVQGDTVPDKDWNWFKSDVWFLGGEGSRIFMIANNLGEKCIIERVFTNADELNFQCIRIPAIRIVDGQEQSAWKERFSIERLQDERESFRRMGALDTFFRERMCEALAQENAPFQKVDFRYYTARDAIEIAKDCNIFTMVDPAYSDKESSDYRAIVTVGVSADNYWFVFDINYGRWQVADLMEQIFANYIRWQPKTTGIEHLNRFESFIIKEQRQRNLFFTLADLKPDRQKESRIQATLQPRIKAHNILFPDEAWYLTELETELLRFPNCLHDDVIDALAYAEQIGFAPNRKKKWIDNFVPENQQSYDPLSYPQMRRIS